MRNDERGSVIVEAAYVFPITFFVIIFLIYMGNGYYLRSQISNCASQAAVIGAERCGDPLAKLMTNSGVQMNTDAQIYRYIFTGYMDEVVEEIQNEVNTKITNSGSFFTGMEASNVFCECKYKGSIVEPAFVVEVNYVIEFPIKFIFADEAIMLDMYAKAEAPIVDMGEFIGVVDMLEDYYQNTGLEEKVNGIKDKISGFFSK